MFAVSVDQRERKVIKIDKNSEPSPANKPYNTNSIDTNIVQKAMEAFTVQV